MYLLDTNHCSRIIQGDTAVLRCLQEKRNALVTTSVIVSGELIFMAENSQQKAPNLKVVLAFLQAIDTYSVDREIANIYGQFKAEIILQFGPREKSRRRTTKIQELGVSDNDLWIAATSLRHSLTIVSADNDFQRMQQVRAFPLESWIEITPPNS